MSKYILAGVVLFGAIILPFLIIRDLRQKRRIKRIIRSYKGKDGQGVKNGKSSSTRQGWGMNNSPFRSRKSGLSWGGGNIKAANAERENRRKFRG
jgi:hypothetical protein